MSASSSPVDFAGAVNCLEGREELIEARGIALFNRMEEMLDYNNIPFYLAEFSITMNDVTKIQEAPWRVWELVDGNYFIEFVDYYLPVDPLDIEVATWDEAFNMYNNYLGDYLNLTDYDDNYICNVYFQQYDPNFNCVEGRYDFVMSGGYTILLVLVEHGVENEDNYYEAVLQQYDGVTMETNIFTVQFYVYVTPEGDVFMLPVDPLD